MNFCIHPIIIESSPRESQREWWVYRVGSQYIKNQVCILSFLSGGRIVSIYFEDLSLFQFDCCTKGDTIFFRMMNNTRRLLGISVSTFATELNINGRSLPEAVHQHFMRPSETKRPILAWLRWYKSKSVLLGIMPNLGRSYWTVTVRYGYWGLSRQPSPQGPTMLMQSQPIVDLYALFIIMRNHFFSRSSLWWKGKLIIYLWENCGALIYPLYMIN